MQLSQWLFFVTSTVLISATPGPNMLLAFQFGLNYGFKKTLWTLLGLSVGLMVVLGLSLGGVAWMSQQAPWVFEAFKCLGALYLLYLGYRSWHSQDASLSNSQGVAVVPTPLALFRAGVAVSLSNPKAILFFAALFPSFIDTRLPTMSQYGILVATFFMIEITWQLIYTVCGQVLSQWLQQGRRLLWLNRSCAVVFAVIALSLMADSMRVLWPLL